MARGKQRKRPARRPAPQEPQDRPALSPRVLLAGVLALVLVGVISYVAIGSGDETEDESASPTEDLRVPWIDPDGVAPIVGSVDVNPADDSVWLSTNTGLFRIAPGDDSPERVTGELTTDLGTGSISEQLVIRFRGADDVIASGHPPPGEALPAALGLIASDDGGENWTGVGKVGRSDYHAIQVSGDVIVGSVFGQSAVAVSRDGGKTFEIRTPPQPVVDLEVDPEDPARFIASNAGGIVASTDQGESWRPVEPIPNVRFTWPASDALYRIDPGGQVKFSADRGRTWEDRGSTGGEPQSMFADGTRHLYVALIDGTIKESRDGGETWSNRVSVPPA
jgi:hypothetical protein